MTLEAAIAEQTTILKAIHASLMGNRETGALAAADKPKAAAFDPNSDKTQAIPKEEMAKALAAAKAAEAPVAIDYEKHIKPLALKLAAIPADKGGGRDALIKICTSFKKADGSACATAKDVLPADHGALVAALNTAIGA